MSVTAVADLRTATRIGVRTPVLVYAQNASGVWEKIRAWTDDLSTTGARITSEREQTSTDIWVRIMLPALKDQVISAQIVREIDGLHQGCGSIRNIRHCQYGIQFTGLADESVIAQIQAIESH